MSKNKIISLARRKVELESLRLFRKPRMVGNSGGFNILSEIRSLKAKVEQYDKKLHEQKDEYDKKLNEQKAEIAMLHQRQIRNAKNELIGKSSKREQFSKLRQERNKEHGANVGFYRYVVNAPGSEKDREDACAEGFKETYGITPEEYDSHFKEAPEKILQYVNHRGDVWHYWPYTKSKHHKPEVEKMKETSDEIVKLWMCEGKTITEKIKEKMSEFDQLHELWKEGEEEKKRGRRKRKGGRNGGEGEGKGKGKAEDNHSASPRESDVQ